MQQKGGCMGKGLYLSILRGNQNGTQSSSSLERRGGMMRCGEKEMRDA